MTDLITSSDLADFAAVAKAPPETEIIAEEDKFVVRVTIRNKKRTVAAIIKGKTLHERKFPTISAASSFLLKTNIRQFKIDARFIKPATGVRAPANRTRLLEMHRLAKQAAEHAVWLDKEIEASIADPRPEVPNAEANAMFDANLARLRAIHEGKAKRVVAGKKAVKA